MHKYLVDLLFCPNCGGNLVWKIQEKTENENIYSGSAKCSACRKKYPIIEGIGDFSNSMEKDPWKDAYQQLTKFMKSRDGKEFLRIPYNELNPADRLFQAFMLEINGDLRNSQKAENSAISELYSEDYTKCWESQSNYIANTLSKNSKDFPIVDLASGRGILAEFLARKVNAPIILSDISQTILDRDRKMFELNNLNEKIDFLAFDIKHIPFRNDSISTVTTNLGLQNVSETSGHVNAALNEIKRISSDTFFGISNFYDPEDKKNGERISELGVSWSFYKDDFLKRFRRTGLEISVENIRKGRSDPTPPGNYFKDAKIDSIPVESTLTEWCTVVAKNHASELK